MKYLFLAFITLNVMASNWMRESKIAAGSLEGYQLKSECEKNGELCADVGDEPQFVKEGFITSKKNWSEKYDEQSCSDQSSCQEILDQKPCQHKFISQGFSSVYCVNLEGLDAVIDQDAINIYKSQN